MSVVACAFGGFDMIAGRMTDPHRTDMIARRAARVETGEHAGRPVISGTIVAMPIATRYGYYTCGQA
ncbi:MAG: hypothetical protein DI530_02815 [Sphingomonas sp.]|uniref:Uncharacterized protein n=1 Tax=Sphingomonas adhaesiva TaxID=28212 RepID=A0A2A4IAS6_9SPHN|nr:hypothetical protein COA07_04765 [Sphingomonas adhaesiva]PZU81408.1 MAG: hypothetical protein DI530_02815 [Sphingomonas sp.]